MCRRTSQYPPCRRPRAGTGAARRLWGACALCLLLLAGPPPLHAAADIPADAPRAAAEALRTDRGLRIPAAAAPDASAASAP
ncbi:hypothetical protein, partial [uncultured Desulfovibrio sp.]